MVNKECQWTPEQLKAFEEEFTALMQKHGVGLADNTAELFVLEKIDMHDYYKINKVGQIERQAGGY